MTIRFNMKDCQARCGEASPGLPQVVSPQCLHLESNKKRKQSLNSGHLGSFSCFCLYANIHLKGAFCDPAEGHNQMCSRSGTDCILRATILGTTWSSVLLQSYQKFVLRYDPEHKIQPCVFPHNTWLTWDTCRGQERIIVNYSLTL